MRPYRDLKIASLIQQELNKILLKDFDFGNDILVTIIDVEVDKKLREAKIKLSVIPFEKGPKVFEILDQRKSQLRFQLLKKMNIKPMPNLKLALEK